LLDAGLAAVSPGCPAAPNSAPGGGRDDSGAIALAFDLLSPYHVAVDDTNVYWTDSSGDRVMRAPIAGGWPTVVASTGTPSPAGIAVDGTSVYWASTGGQRLLKCPKDACDCVPTVIAAPFDVTEIALDAQNVYASVGGRLLACAISGCRNNPTVLVSGLGAASAIAVDKVNVYWVNSKVMKCAVGGCANAPTVLAAGPPSPQGIAVDGKNVYWTDYSGGAVLKCAISGCPGGPSVVASDAGQPAGIATDGVRAFFTDIGPASSLSINTGRVLACPVGGCATPTVLLSSIPNSWSIALDATRVYVAGGRRVIAIDK
jgi:hypothetical protein